MTSGLIWDDEGNDVTMDVLSDAVEAMDEPDDHDERLARAIAKVNIGRKRSEAAREERVNEVVLGNALDPHEPQNEISVEWTLPPHAAEVLAMFGFPHGADVGNQLMWRTYDDGTIKLMADCSDTFGWAIADSERIEPEDLSLLRQCLTDLSLTIETEYLAELYAARKRNRRPMKLYLDTVSEPTRKLFEALPDLGEE